MKRRARFDLADGETLFLNAGFITQRD
jgi:transcriptional regulator with GAF, ATPase, and Fis domain